MDSVPTNAREYRLWWAATYPDTPYGFCACGCGEQTTLADKTDYAYGSIKGEPRPYRQGHNTRISPVPYLETDKGYVTPCWIWQRSRITGKYNTLYGQIKPPGCSPLLAHRVYYERHNGSIPNGLCIHHKCEQTLCVRPDHLQAVTQAENVQAGTNVKLDADKVRQIRSLYESGSHTIAELSRMFGVAPNTLRYAVKYLTWRNV